MSFVDLAGSERLKKSRALDGKETGSINKSLMTLGKVISALSRRSAVAASSAAAAAAATPSSMVSAGILGAFISIQPTMKSMDEDFCLLGETVADGSESFCLS